MVSFSPFEVLSRFIAVVMHGDCAASGKHAVACRSTVPGAGANATIAMDLAAPAIGVFRASLPQV